MDCLGLQGYVLTLLTFEFHFSWKHHVPSKPRDISECTRSINSYSCRVVSRIREKRERERGRELVLVKQPWNHYNLVSRTRVASYLSRKKMSSFRESVAYECAVRNRSMEKRSEITRPRNRIPLESLDCLNV